MSSIRSAPFSQLGTPWGIRADGMARDVQMCVVGTTQLGSSRVPAATIVHCGVRSGSCHRRQPQIAQREESDSFPPAARLGDWVPLPCLWPNEPRGAYTGIKVG